MIDHQKRSVWLVVLVLCFTVIGFGESTYRNSCAGVNYPKIFDLDQNHLILREIWKEKQQAKVKERIDKCVKEKLLDSCNVLNIQINKANVKKNYL
ncbi:hypothetical protein PIB30_068653 [Stylosanthes scabra]|uniref:Uncharacterized protein n=1 Tax=Stylosanthes scabra TaxID=79078 RepID=A0ABU6YMD8_9FABA|nr:hypothetical protein [Stylosanthes scabra]